MATFTADNPKIASYLEILEDWLGYSKGKEGPKICDYFYGRNGGIVFRLEDDTEFLVADDEEADAILRREVKAYMSNYAHEVNLSAAHYLPDEALENAKIAQEQDDDVVSAILLKYLDEAVA